MRRCAWLLDIRCGETVEASWCSSIHGMGDDAILKKVDRCGKDLSWWNRNIFGNVKLELERKRKMLVQAERKAVRNGLNFQVWELKDEINIFLDREAQMWSQRSQVLWLTNGDRNTKYFHTKATQRHRKKMIGGIRDDQNIWQHNPEGIESVILNYYQALLSPSTPVDQVTTLDQIPQIITEEMNQLLTENLWNMK